MTEPALSLTDLALGVTVVVIALVLRARRLPRQWLRMFWWTAAAAFAGFAHHGWLVSWTAVAEPSFVVANGLVVVALSYMLAASFDDVVGGGRRDVVQVVRFGSLCLYVALSVAGRSGAGSLMLAEAVTMVMVVGLWVRALLVDIAGARWVVFALMTSAVAGCVNLLPERLTRVVGLDPASLYHVAQVPGLVFLAWAIDRMHAADRRQPPGALSTTKWSKLAA